MAKDEPSSSAHAEFVICDNTILMVSRYRGEGTFTFASKGQESHLDVSVATHKKIDLVLQTRVFKLKRDMQKRPLDSASSPPLGHNSVAEVVTDETSAHPATIVRRRPAPTRASTADDQDDSRRSGGTKCK